MIGYLVLARESLAPGLLSLPPVGYVGRISIDLAVVFAVAAASFDFVEGPL
jgi:hypothetical protein